MSNPKMVEQAREAALVALANLYPFDNGPGNSRLKLRDVIEGIAAYAVALVSASAHREYDPARMSTEEVDRNDCRRVALLVVGAEMSVDLSAVLQALAGEVAGLERKVFLLDRAFGDGTGVRVTVERSP